MLNHFKKLFTALLVMLCFSSLSFASVGVQVNGKDSGAATGINFIAPSGTIVANPYGFVPVPYLGTALAATGTGNGGGTSMTSAQLAIVLGYSLVKKWITSDTAFQAGTLANGTNGQILTVQITQVTGTSSYTITPVTSFGWTSITFTVIGQTATFEYGPSGWIILHTGSLNIANTTLPVVVDAGGT